MTKLEEWIGRYFAESQLQAVRSVLDGYGSEAWHREPGRVRRDAVIISRGSFRRLRGAIRLAMRDYRDVLVSEEVDPWVIGELKKYGKN